MPILDKSIYPSDWKERSRAAIARAGNCCEECGAPNGQWIVRRRGQGAWHLAGSSELAGGPEDGEYLTRVVLTVHHKVPAGDGGSHEPSNLLSLCQLHHLRLDAPLHARNAAVTRARKDRLRRMVAGQEALI